MIERDLAAANALDAKGKARSIKTRNRRVPEFGEGGSWGFQARQRRRRESDPADGKLRAAFVEVTAGMIRQNLHADETRQNGGSPSARPDRRGAPDGERFRTELPAKGTSLQERGAIARF